MNKNHPSTDPSTTPAVQGTCSGDSNSLRIERPQSLLAQVEQILRKAISQGGFAGNRLPTEIELADQMGVSRETVRRATETLQREGVVVKYRRKGTFLRRPELTLDATQQGTAIGYLQAAYGIGATAEEAVTRTTSGLMLQGALAETGRAGLRLLVQDAPNVQLLKVFQRLHDQSALRGVIFVSCGEEKLLKRVAGLGVATVLLDHDLPLPAVNSVRDDSFEGAREAVRHLVALGHRRIAFATWRQVDLNPWRLRGYRRGMRDAGLPRRRIWEMLTDLTKAGARRVVAQWLQLTPRPTALYCFNNTLARYVIDELGRRHISVPETLSVMGGGGEEVASLTYHQTDWFEMGRRSVQILVRALASPNEHVPEHHLLPHSVRVGRTTAPPASQ